MKNRFVRVLVITIIASFIYINFFVEEVVDKPKNENTIVKQKKDSINQLDTISFNKEKEVVKK